MSSYCPILHLDVNHGFYQNGKPSNLEFRFDSPTTKLLENAGALIKISGAGLSVLASDTTREALQLTLDAYQEELASLDDELLPPERPVLTLRVYDRSRLFNAISDIEVLPTREVVFLNNDVNRAEPFTYLHSANQVTSANVLAFSDASLQPLVTRTDSADSPVLLIQFFIDRLMNHVRQSEPPLKAVDYRVAFASKQLCWKYLILGHEKYDNISISDSQQQIHFQFQGTERIGDRETLVYLSDQPIQHQEQQEHRFQLNAKTQNINKILVKRLPVASISKVNKFELDGKQAEVSEIFVNL